MPRRCIMPSPHSFHSLHQSGHGIASLSITLSLTLLVNWFRYDMCVWFFSFLRLFHPMLYPNSMPHTKLRWLLSTYLKYYLCEAGCGLFGRLESYEYALLDRELPAFRAYGVDNQVPTLAASASPDPGSIQPKTSYNENEHSTVGSYIKPLPNCKLTTDCMSLTL